MEGEIIGANVETLRQYYMMVTCKWRLAALLSFLQIHKKKKIVVFFCTCDSVDYHAMLLREMEWPTQLDDEIPWSGDEDSGKPMGIAAIRQHIRNQMGKGQEVESLEPLGSAALHLFRKEGTPLYRLHGNVVQKDRQFVYREFSRSTNGVLFCTDVAARGLDMPNIDWILQYDPPCETTDYIHRVGRTARKGQSGQSLIFLLPSEAPYVQLLSSHSLVPEPLSLQSLLHDASDLIPGATKFKNSEEMGAVILQRRVERVALANRYLMGAARQAFRSYVRAYATHGAGTKSIFRVQLLHLGHVAKSFALRENPTTLRNQEDIIAKIANGEFACAMVNQNMGKESKKIARDRKYGLAASVDRTRDGLSYSSKNSGCHDTGKQALRKMSKKSKVLTASGKFRKAGSSYFRKKLKAQTTSEFSDGR